MVLLETREAERQKSAHPDVYVGMPTAGCEPDEIRLGAMLAVPKSLRRGGLNVGEFCLPELNQTFACYAVYCRDRIGLTPECASGDGGQSRSVNGNGCPVSVWPVMNRSRANAVVYGMWRPRCVSPADWALRRSSKSTESRLNQRVL